MHITWFLDLRNIHFLIIIQIKISFKQLSNVNKKRNRTWYWLLRNSIRYKIFLAKSGIYFYIIFIVCINMKNPNYNAIIWSLISEAYHHSNSLWSTYLNLIFFIGLRLFFRSGNQHHVKVGTRKHLTSGTTDSDNGCSVLVKQV